MLHVSSRIFFVGLLGFSFTLNISERSKMWIKCSGAVRLSKTEDTPAGSAAGGAPSTE